MKIGCCASGIVPGDSTGAAAAEQLAQIGFDYAELALAPIAALPDEDFDRLATQAASSGIACYACNIFFPRTVRLTGPDVDWAQVEDYAARAIGRAARLGVQIIVLGSGGSRNVPEGFPMERAWEQMAEALRRIAPIAEQHGITIVIEPLNTRESNIITTAGDGLRLARQVSRPAIKLLVDFYHLALEHESPDILLEAGDYIRHIHVARPEGRAYPTTTEDQYRPFFANLKAIGYTGGISVEGRTSDFAADAPAALQVLRQLAG